MTTNKNTASLRGFTIVEVLVVIICIGILAGIIVVGYGAVSRNAKETSLKSDLVQGSTEISTSRTHSGSMPTDASGISKKPTTTYTSYVHNDANKTFCLAATDSSLPGLTLRVTEKGEIEEGDCDDIPVAAGDSMQNITTATCPASRTLVVDGRDRSTYWVQKLADNRCWMLTNLAYAGGGNDAYGDTKTLTNSSSFGTASYTAPYFMIGPNTRATTYPTEPKISTDGGTTNPQHGFFYNWCAALGGQSGTSACLNASSPSYNASSSVCPSGWRLPTGGPYGEVAGLVSAIGATNNTSGANIARSTLIYQQSGTFRVAYTPQSFGYWWTSSQAASGQGYMLSVGPSTVNGAGTGSKDTGFPVRCLAL